MTKLDLFQSFLGDAQRRHVSPAAIPYDVGRDTGNEEREYGLFKRIYSQREPGSGPWGLVSWKFEHKSLVPVERFYEFATKQIASGEDCVFLNPMIGNAAMHANVWEQWAFANQAIPDLVAFLGTVGDVDYNRVMDENTFAFCNYFVATSRFWEAYFAFVDRFIEHLEAEKAAGSPVGQFYAGSARYKRNSSLTTKPFIVERLFSSFLASDPDFKWSSYPHQPQTYLAKFGQRLGEVLFRLADLKRRGADGDAAAYALWDRLRRQLAAEQMYAMWQMDDPTELLLSEEFQLALASDAAPPPALS
jgi:hypothetical protein